MIRLIILAALLPLVALAQSVPLEPPATGDVAVSTLYAVLGLVLAVELLRWLAPPLRRKAGVSLPQWGRYVVLALVVVVGQALAFAGALPVLLPGAGGQAMAGFVVSALAVLFNETIFDGLRKVMGAAVARVVAAVAGQSK